MESLIACAGIPEEFFTVAEDGAPTEEPEPGAVDETATGRKPRNRGCFFSIDKRTWEKLAHFENMNAACAYIVLARGIDRRSNRESRLSKWSKKALKAYLGVGWDNAKEAIEFLIKHGFVRIGEGSTSSRPVYELLPYSEVAGPPREVTLDDLERQVIAKLQEGKQPRSKEERAAARSLAKKGLVIHYDGTGWSDFEWRPPISDGAEHRIWLPNSIVDGGKELPPLRRLRRYGDFWVLRTLVDLYFFHNLPNYGGISRNIIARTYERLRVGQQGHYIVWGFREKSLLIHKEGPLGPHLTRQGLGVGKRAPGQAFNIGEIINVLQDLGLISFVPYLYEHEGQQAEPIHPIGNGGTAEAPVEEEIGRAADAAARAMCLQDRLSEAECSIHCPVEKTIPSPQLVGILRMTYRPWTRRTAAWYAALNRDAAERIELYRRVERKANEIAERSSFGDFQ